LVVKKTFSLLAGLVLLVAAFAANARAQSLADQSRPEVAKLRVIDSPAPAPTHATAPRVPQNIIASLANMPEADALIYVNPQRIFNEVLPKILPAKDVEEMRKGFEEVKKNAGFDPTKVDYLVIAVRFNKPSGDLNFRAPEFMVVSSGDFSAESLITLARMASGGKLRDEQYGNKTLGLMTIEPLAKESEKNPLLKSFTEVGVVALNANTIASGSPGYLRSAIDAANGKDRISAETLNSLVRDPNVLVSFAGSPWHSFAKSFGMLGTQTTARTPTCESKLGDAYVALTMDANNFMIRGNSNADNPDTAKIFANLYAGLLQYATTSIPDEATKALLRGISITAEGDEVLLRADFAQQMLIDLIQKQMAPKKDEANVITAPPTKPAVKRRRGRTRRGY
jgi:hypothetical protein